MEFAEKAGFFKEAGLVVEPFYTDGGAATLTTVLSGSADVGLSNGLLGVIGAYVKGAPVRVISAQMTGAGELYWYVKSDSPDRFTERPRDQDRVLLLAGLVVEPDPAGADEAGRLECQDGRNRRRACDADPGDDGADRCRLGRRAVRAASN